MDDTIAGPEDVTNYLSAPVIGTIPRISISKEDDPATSLVTTMDSKSSCPAMAQTRYSPGIRDLMIITLLGDRRRFSD